MKLGYGLSYGEKDKASSKLGNWKFMSSHMVTSCPFF